MPVEQQLIQVSDYSFEDRPALKPEEFRRRGDLERNYGMPRLAPTEISTEARERLTDMGVSPDGIESLLEFTSSFRYDLVSEKVKELAKKPIKIFKYNEKEYVGLPLPFYAGRFFDGECRGIATQWLFKFHESQLIEKLNQDLGGENEIVPMLYEGLSKTHFSHEEDNHNWTGLALVTKPALDDKDKHPLHEVYVDPSFQTIETKEKSGYIERESLINPEKFSFEEQIFLEIGSFDVSGYKLESEPESAILGASSDRKYAYTLGFSRDITNVIRPILGRINEDGTRECYFFDNDGKIMATNHANMGEVREMLTLLEGLTFDETEELPKGETVVFVRN